MGAFSTCEPSPCHSETASISGYSHTGSIASQTQVRENVKTLYTRVHNALVRHARRKEKRVVEISAPFDMKSLPVSIPGVSEDDILIMREKAVASQIGIADPIASEFPEYPVMLPRRARSPFPNALPAHLTASTQNSGWY